MDTFHHLVKAILVIIILYALALVMKKRGALAEEHSMVLARIVTDLCLPAMIFVSLAGQSVQLSQLQPAFVMLGAELVSIAVAWLLAVWLHVPRVQLGAVVFCAAFGSSTFLGYPLIIEMFPQKPEALTEAVLISEIGVGYPIFILGPILAVYFGSGKGSLKRGMESLFQFLRSPVFFALIIGIFWGNLHLPGKDHSLLGPLFQVCHILASALTPLAILSVGLMFKIPKFRNIILALVIVVGIKLIAKPLLVAYASSILGFPHLWNDVLVILAAMPPAVLGAVFLRRYGNDAAQGSLASTLLLAASIVSCISLVAVFWAVG